MYELTCPFCKATTTSSFVRVGAVAICRQCRHQFSIKSENVQHVAKPAAPSEQAGAPVAVPEPAPGDETAFPAIRAAAAGAAARADPPAGHAATLAPLKPAVHVPAPSAGLPSAASAAHLAAPAAAPRVDRGHWAPRFGNYDISPLTWLIAGAILAGAAWGTWFFVQRTGNHADHPTTPASAPATQGNGSGPAPIR